MLLFPAGSLAFCKERADGQGASCLLFNDAGLRFYILVELRHRSMKIGLHPQKSQTGGTDHKKGKGKKSQPQAKHTPFLPFHKLHAGQQGILRGTGEIIQQDISGKTKRQSCDESGHKSGQRQQKNRSQGWEEPGGFQASWDPQVTGYGRDEPNQEDKAAEGKGYQKDVRLVLKAVEQP